MSSLLTATGRDVLFAHWPVEPGAVDSVVPDPLEPDTFDGSAWVSALALESGSLVPGPAALSRAPGGGFPQLNFRTYVTLAGEPGVYFISLYSGRRVPAAVGRRAFGLPFRHARTRMTRRGDRVTFRSHREGEDAPAAVFQARYRPSGETYRAAPGSLESFCIEHFHHYLPATEDRRIGGIVRRSAADESGVYVGRIQRDPWDLQPVTATIRENTLFEANGLPTPTADPVFHYSPGFEMGVESMELRSSGEFSGSDARS